MNPKAIELTIPCSFTPTPEGLVLLQELRREALIHEESLELTDRILAHGSPPPTKREPTAFAISTATLDCAAGQNLTLATLAKAVAQLQGLPHGPCGFAAHPDAVRHLNESLPFRGTTRPEPDSISGSVLSRYQGTPIAEDARLPRDQIRVFHDQAEWLTYLEDLELESGRQENRNPA